MNRLDVVPAVRALLDSGGFTGQRGRRVTRRPVTYLDWRVDGTRLHDLLERGLGEPLDHTGALDEGWPDEAVRALRRLLGEEEPDLPSGRISLYVCPECGDLGCGAVTAHVELGPETVTWAAFGMERGYDADNVELAQFADVGPLHFDRTAYETLLRAQLDRFSALAREQAAARGESRPGLLRRLWRRARRGGD